MDKAILVNAEFLHLIVANPEVFGHDVDCEDTDEEKLSGALHSHVYGLYMHEQGCHYYLTSAMQVI